jgi:hypothetical protein
MVVNDMYSPAESILQGLVQMKNMVQRKIDKISEKTLDTMRYESLLPSNNRRIESQGFENLI